MTRRASSQFHPVVECSMPDHGVAAPRRTLLFEGRVPDFAQPAWLAVQRALPAPESDNDKSARAYHRRCYTYAVMEGARPVLILFFHIKGKCIVVLNDAALLAGVDLQDFSHYVFSQFRQIKRICFQAQRRYIFCPGIRGSRNPESRLVLPARPSLRLEEATHFNRQKVTYFLQRLKRDYPGFGLECYSDEAIARADCLALLQMNRPRPVDQKGEDDPIDALSEELIRAVQVAGLLGLLKIDGRIVAGVICCRVGGEWRISCLACDPCLQAYGLGMLCLYFTACVHIDSLRKQAGETILRPRYTHNLIIQQERITVMTLRRPHVSWWVRCDRAVYETVMGYLRSARQLQEECMQVGTAFVRLLGGWKQAFQSAKKRCATLLGRSWGRSAFLRSNS